MDVKNITIDAIGLLRQLIEIPSYSKDEAGTADLIRSWLQQRNISVRRHGNNIIAHNKYFDDAKPSLLLNSHHDTVKPASGYTRDPFCAELVDGKLYGLGSNDAGGALVSLIAAFVYFYEHNQLPFNIILAATAEEEISGAGGIASILNQLPDIACAIVGEPTLMNMAVAERGLMVCEAVATGISGHAARYEGDNAIYKAMQDISWIGNHQFEHSSHLLGPVTMQVTSIETINKAHNIVPDHCSFVIDVRLNERYTHEAVLAILQSNMKSTVVPRSMRLRSTAIPLEHPLVKSGLEMGMQPYGSPTLSDKALMTFPALKLGPGDSARSHTADEFIFIEEIRKGIFQYIKLIEHYLASGKCS